MKITDIGKSEGVPARCLACGQVFPHQVDEGACPRCSSPSVVPLIFLPTTTVIAGFLCVLTWQLEFFVAAVHFLAGKRVNAVGHVVLISASVSLTIIVFLKGKRELAKVRALGARAAITGLQASMLVLILLVFAALLSIFVGWQFG